MVATVWVFFFGHKQRKERAMSRTLQFALLVVSLCFLPAATASAGALTDGMTMGKPGLESAGVLAFGPKGILFVGDPQSATIFAIDTQDRDGGSAQGTLEIPSIDEKVAALLGTEPKQILINDLAVNPASGRAYLAVARGLGPDATPVLLRVDRTGKISEFALDNVKFSKMTLTNAPDPDEKDRRGQSKRRESITDIGYVAGEVVVAGLSNEEFASKLRAIPFPFTKSNTGASVEIYHGAHGKFETRSPVRTFAPFEINGQPHLLAAYTCTPLVAFPISQLKPGSHVKGKTIAELGNRNRPLDMIVYHKAGKAHLLLSNSSRGVMKITTEGLDKAESITEHVSGGGTKGTAYDTIAELKGVEQLDRLDEGHALILARSDSGKMNLETVALP